MWGPTENLAGLAAALNKLAAEHHDKAEQVKLRCFTRVTILGIAEGMKVTLASAGATGLTPVPGFTRRWRAGTILPVIVKESQRLSGSGWIRRRTGQATRNQSDAMSTPSQVEPIVLAALDFQERIQREQRLTARRRVATARLEEAQQDRTAWFAEEDAF